MSCDRNIYCLGWLFCKPISHHVTEQACCELSSCWLGKLRNVRISAWKKVPHYWIWFQSNSLFPHLQLPLAWTPCKSTASLTASPQFTINPQHNCAIEFHLKGTFTFVLEALSCGLFGYQTLRLLFTEAHTRPSHPRCTYIFNFFQHWFVSGWLLSFMKQTAAGCRFEWVEAHLSLCCSLLTYVCGTPNPQNLLPFDR